MKVVATWLFVDSDGFEMRKPKKTASKF